jgi:hypothetical protein
LRDDSGTPRGEQLELELGASVAESPPSARARGRKLDFAAAAERALDVLETLTQ